MAAIAIGLVKLSAWEWAAMSDAHVHHRHLYGRIFRKMMIAGAASNHRPRLNRKSPRRGGHVSSQVQPWCDDLSGTMALKAPRRFLLLSLGR